MQLNAEGDESTWENENIQILIYTPHRLKNAM